MSGVMNSQVILRPNPILFDLESRKKKPGLAHELGEGAPCQRCGDKCPGFQLHFWRKHCCNCQCGKIEHNVRDHVDAGLYFVGRIIDLPERTKEEILQFCWGDLDADNNADSMQNSVSATAGTKSDAAVNKSVKLDWIPPNVSKDLAKRYLKELPEAVLPVVGSDGAKQRQRNLQKQFPVHDVEPGQCHDLTSVELKSMQDYLDHIKVNVFGQGQVIDVNESEKSKDGCLDDPDWFPPPPPPEVLNQIPPVQTSKGLKKVGVFTATPCSVQDTGTPDSLPGSRKESGSMCQFCQGHIGQGQIAIKADRAGPHKMWHPRCFKCHSCKELLVDLLYYYDEGHVFCARDYARIKHIPRCYDCDELIFCAEYTGAEGKFWHLKHFCCWQCVKPLAGHKYVQIEEKPHCLDCYQQFHGKVCQTCNDFIGPEEQRVILDDQSYHATPNCFVCVVCHESLLGRKLIKRWGKLVCSASCLKVATQTQHSLNTPASSKVLLTTDV